MNNTSYICPCCMENHDKKIIKIKESNIFKGVSVDYEKNGFAGIKDYIKLVEYSNGGKKDE